MRLVPTTDELVDAQNAINAQHPSLSDDAPRATHANETDAAGRRVLRLTTQQLATIVSALARATVGDWPPLDAQIAIALGAMALERRPDGRVRAADPREAVPQVERLFALELERRELAAALATVKTTGFATSGLAKALGVRTAREPERVHGGEGLPDVTLQPGPDDMCWHCHVCLTPAPRHCEKCPPEGECDVEGCKEPGCLDVEGARP